MHHCSDYAKQWDTTGKGGVKSALKDWSKQNHAVKILNLYHPTEIPLDRENVVYQDGNGITLIKNI
jgi:hypothetical protein